VAATLEELDARVAALEAEQADYRAVLAAINALGANQREHSERLSAVEGEVGALRGEVGALRGEVRALRDDTSPRIRSLEENVAEMKDLLIRALDR
jgi:uncharacterized coiled-coil protein SlyX